MQALKQAAREGDQVRLDAVCEEWSVSAGAERDAAAIRSEAQGSEKLETHKAEGDAVNVAGVETHR
jgi:hypothetical protein